MYSHVKHPYFPKIELIRKEHKKIFCIFAVFFKEKHYLCHRLKR